MRINSSINLNVFDMSAKHEPADLLTEYSVFLGVMVGLQFVNN